MVSRLKHTIPPYIVVLRAAGRSSKKVQVLSSASTVVQDIPPVYDNDSDPGDNTSTSDIFGLERYSHIMINLNRNPVILVLWKT